MTRPRTRSVPEPPGTGGLSTFEVTKLGSSLASSLGRHLDRKHLRVYGFRTVRGESLRIADRVPLYCDDGQQYPVLQLNPAEAPVGAYLEVALDYVPIDRFTGRLTHVSLKVRTGPSSRASALRFRAEWDPRVEARMHAQPHWNIDQVGGDDTVEIAQSSGTSAPWIPQALPGPWSVTPAPKPADARLDLRKVHFAMGSSWHLLAKGEDRRHSVPFEDEDALVNWISGCAAYIRAQISHA